MKCNKNAYKQGNNVQYNVKRYSSSFPPGNSFCGVRNHLGGTTLEGMTLELSHGDQPHLRSLPSVQLA